jgi:hypothetical protein
MVKEVVYKTREYKGGINEDDKDVGRRGSKYLVKSVIDSDEEEQIFRSSSLPLISPKEYSLKENFTSRNRKTGSYFH